MLSGVWSVLHVYLFAVRLAEDGLRRMREAGISDGEILDILTMPLREYVLRTLRLTGDRLAAGEYPPRLSLDPVEPPVSEDPQ